jgi:putative hemolysin
MLDLQATIAARYPDFVSRHRRVARVLVRLLSLLFYEQRFRRFEEDYPHLRGFDFVEQVLRSFDFHLRLRDSERSRIPSSGRVIIVANHPIGSLDGLALLHLVRGLRPDVKVVANELLTAIAPLHDVLLPVVNMGRGRSRREHLRKIRAHLAEERALIIFPAGEVSRLAPSGIRDGSWQSGFVKLALATRSPVLPIHVAGRNSLFFYSLSLMARPLSTLWLVREMFKQSHNTVDARIGCAVPFDSYAAAGVAPQRLAALFRKHVYRLGAGRKPIFRSIETVAPAENRQLLARELQACEHLGSTPDGMEIRICRYAEAPCTMRELGRLREYTFRTVGEGSGQPRDLDRFDPHYLHLVLWDVSEREIAGAYRLGNAAELSRERGLDALYSHSLFQYGEAMSPVIAAGLELGRSFVQPRYQSRHSLDYLWWGIGAFLGAHPEFRYLFGPVSLSRYYGDSGTALVAAYYRLYHNQPDYTVRPRTAFTCPESAATEARKHFVGDDSAEDLRRLKEGLAGLGLPLPTLFKHYAKATEPGGCSFSAFNVDANFGDCADSLIVVDLSMLTARHRRRYLAG